MEAAVTNLLAPGDHALFVNGGKFGERWGKLLAANGWPAIHHSRMGSRGRPDQIGEALRAHSEARALFVQASETSTCHSSDRRNRRADQGSDVLLIVDGITSVACSTENGRLGVDAYLTAVRSPDAAARIGDDRVVRPRSGARSKNARSALLLRLPRELKSQRDITPPRGRPQSR